MRQILQNLKTGATHIAEVPCGGVKPGHLLIRTRKSLISAGTERMLLEFGNASLLGKARLQPAKVKMALEKMRTDGIAATLESIEAKLNQEIPLGYCNCGIVLDVGEGVEGFLPGDRVVSNGCHAEVVQVPKNLCALVPPGVSDEHAAFAVTAAIGLQGLRLAAPTLGESFAVTGLGLIGLLTVQLLRAHGCRVLGLDFDPAKLALARQMGAETVDLSSGADPAAAASQFSCGRGVDGVLITAATASNDPVHQAAVMSRKRGRIILVGVSGLLLSRDDFYQKELSFQVSCSYGPGRYDSQYEEAGHDYPLGYVRWTEQRNIEAVLDLMADGRIEAESLITHRFRFEEAHNAYAALKEAGAVLGILLAYGEMGERSETDLLNRRIQINPHGIRATSAGNIGFVGAGEYASKVLLPGFRSSGARLRSIASSGGLTSARAARRFGFEIATTDVDDVLADHGIDTVVIATRHDSHADLVCRAIQAGKNVFVEKPLAVTRRELQAIESAYLASVQRCLMVGFNRRFAPHVKKIKTLLRSAKESKTFIMTVNAGSLPNEHWAAGERVVGEACHFVDLLRFLAGSPIVSVRASRLGRGRDDVIILLWFEDGSQGTVHYLTNGHKSFGKEKLQVFCGGRILELDNFRRLTGYGWPGFRKLGSWRQDKGNAACIAAFMETVRSGGPPPIPFGELIEVSRTMFDILEVL